MKKLILAMLLLASVCKAQSWSGNPPLLSPYFWHDPRATAAAGVMELGRDSVSSGTTILAPTASMQYANTDSVLSGDSYRAGSVSFTLTKVSGTVAGKAYMMGSPDGANWTGINDTLTLTNSASQNMIFELPGKPKFSNGGTENGKVVQYDTPAVLPYLYYRIYIAGTGTWCGTFYTSWVVRN